MAITTNRLRLGIASVLAVGLSACSGPHEDVRVTLCKDVANGLTGTTKDQQWGAIEQRFKYPEFATLTIPFTDTAGTSRRIACSFDYEAVEDTALTLADPLSAYATLPYAISLDGVAVGQGELRDAVRSVQLQHGQELLERIQAGVVKAAEQVKQGLSR